jgi:myo-inositol-hexaphosphate 3-phosphohydrolase
MQESKQIQKNNVRQQLIENYSKMIMTISNKIKEKKINFYIMQINLMILKNLLDKNHPNSKISENIIKL